jgi:hypothetical protein
MSLNFCDLSSYHPPSFCLLKDDMAGMIPITSKQRVTLQLQSGISKRREFNLFENFIRKHRNANDESLIHIQFQLNDSEHNWSGPVCIASLGRFFLKFRKQQSNQATAVEKDITEYATVHVVEEGSSLVLHFQKPPDISLPYRIENCLGNVAVAITYYQKVVLLFHFPPLSTANLVGADWNCFLFVNFFDDHLRILQESLEREVLKFDSSVDYVWDDLTLPHKLVVQINGTH